MLNVIIIFKKIYNNKFFLILYNNIRLAPGINSVVAKIITEIFNTADKIARYLQPDNIKKGNKTFMEYL